MRQDMIVRILNFYFLIFFISESNSQSVIFDGQLKLNNVSINDTSEDILTINKYNFVEKRDVNGIIQCPSTGIILDTNENNNILFNNGFSNVGHIYPEIFEESTDATKYGEWTLISNINAPESRTESTTIWTGNEMIIWGGWGKNSHLANGAKYNPATNVWMPTSNINAPAPRALHTAVWTGNKMIIWGGYFGNGTGAAYDPSTNEWTAISNVNAPSDRYSHSAVWTGTEMIIWGGLISTNNFNNGFIYNPISDSWSEISMTNAPSPRHDHTCIWTGTEMIIWGGYHFDSQIYLNDGAKYNPVTDSWTPITQINAPEARINNASIWTGTEMIIWGGYNGLIAYGGAKYNPNNNTWINISKINAPEEAQLSAFAWTGSEMIIWGGVKYGEVINSGAKYNPSTNSWIKISLFDSPEQLTFSSFIWAGNELLLWSGNHNPPHSSNYRFGFKYYPILNGHKFIYNKKYFLYKKN